MVAAEHVLRVPLRLHRPQTLVGVTVAIFVFGLVMAPLFVAGTAGAVLTMAIGLSLMGMTYGPIGTVLSELFPTAVRYTGSSLTFNLAGIFGASLAPYIATWLAQRYGLQYVGYYLSAAAAITLVTYLAVPQGFIFFGILHQIALASVLGLLFLRLPALLTLVVAALVLGLGVITDPSAPSDLPIQFCCIVRTLSGQPSRRSVASSSSSA